MKPRRMAGIGLNVGPLRGRGKEPGVGHGPLVSCHGDCRCHGRHSYGFPVNHVAANDGGVWVTDDNLGLGNQGGFGGFNVPITELGTTSSILAVVSRAI